MSGFLTEQISKKQRKIRLKWTEEMNTVLLECRRRAKDLVQSADPPRKSDGRKKGYMAIMKDLWDNSKFANIDITTQNLRDQAAKIVKSLGNAGKTVREESSKEPDLLQFNVCNSESNTLTAS